MAGEDTLPQDLKKALTTLRENAKKRKFDQSVDLILNLQKFDARKQAVNTFITLPHKVKDKKVCGFFESKNAQVDTVMKDEFVKYANDKKAIKKLSKHYDFFIAEAKLMPAVASTFGRALGPSGKMPSPQLGIVPEVSEKAISEVMEKINQSMKIRTKEATLKLAIGKESMKDEEIIENAMAIYHEMVKQLPRDKENIKNVEIKFTMTKPVKIAIR